MLQVMPPALRRPIDLGYAVRMSFELKPYTFAEIVAVFRDGSRDKELDSHALHEWPQLDSSAEYTAETTFYLLPIPDYSDEGEALWEAEGEEVHDLVSRLGFNDGFLGQHLTDTLSLIREQAPESSIEQIADAFSYYLHRDTWPDWLTAG